jgi:hypothetical protein
MNMMSNLTPSTLFFLHTPVIHEQNYFRFYTVHESMLEIMVRMFIACVTNIKWSLLHPKIKPFEQDAMLTTYKRWHLVKDMTLKRRKRLAGFTINVDGSSPSSGSESTFCFSLLLTEFSTVSERPTVVESLLCYPGSTLFSQCLKPLSKAG